MKATFWGVRGSLPSAGPDTIRYGGNTSCVQVSTGERSVAVLDAGSGLRRLGEAVPEDVERIDLLLTHLHVDHIIGLGFFAPLFRPDLEVHIWGPSSTQSDLHARLGRYLNPPLFPVRLPDLPSDVHLHDVPLGARFEIPGLSVRSDLVFHPGPAVGYRLEDAAGASLAYLPDHEPRLGGEHVPVDPAWLSGFDLAEGVDLLIHDAQYEEDEYADRIGWGHATRSDAVGFASIVGAGHLVPFHHDPGRTDDAMDRMWDRSAWDEQPAVPVTVAREGLEILVGAPA